MSDFQQLVQTLQTESNSAQMIAAHLRASGLHGSAEQWELVHGILARILMDLGL